MDVFTAILESAGGLLTKIFSLIGDAFNGVVSVFYTAGSGETPGKLTLIGSAMAFILGAALVAAAIYIIYRLITRVTGRVTGGVRAIK